MRVFRPRWGRGAFAGLGIATLLLAAMSSAVPLQGACAEDASGTSTPPPAAAAPSQSVVINLIRLLVQEGVLTQDKANALIRQAQDEAAAAARGQSVGTAPASAAQTGVTSAQPPSVRVPYIPQIVRNQIRDEVKQEVLQQAKAENWAAPNALPEWTKRFHLEGDVRLRYEWDLFDKRNDNGFANFAAANAGSPIDVNGVNTLPFLDTTEDRTRVRLRARLGLTAEISDGFSAGLRLATGNTTNPVSTNQTLGTNLNKDNFLLDRAYLKYQPVPTATFWAGRFANPWFSTDLVWSNELNFDGLAFQLAPKADSTAPMPFFNAGAFPIENTSFNFPDNSVIKGKSRDKWLYGAQAGAVWQPGHDYGFKFAAAYYDFSKIKGELSAPCLVATAPCSTDDSRPGFLQQGNTLFEIRNNQFGGGTNPQYFGLASGFRELNVNGRFDLARYDPVHVVLDADFVTNLAFNAHAIAAKGNQNNNGPSGRVGDFVGGANGMQLRLTVGHPEIKERWDWNVVAAYKYLESDAVVDAFTDSDFHLGGTNAKGFIFGAGIGVAHDVYLASRWFRASEITGPPYSVDVVQVDVNARF